MTDAVLRQCEFRLWLDELNNTDAQKRLIAGVKVCELSGVLPAVRGLAPDGSLRPPPSWPLVDVVPDKCEVHGNGVSAMRVLVVLVRTLVGGVPLRVDYRVDVPLADGALMECVERGRAELRRRIEGMVVG